MKMIIWMTVLLTGMVAGQTDYEYGADSVRKQGVPVMRRWSRTRRRKTIFRPTSRRPCNNVQLIRPFALQTRSRLTRKCRAC